jgi:hypothetical protein
MSCKERVLRDGEATEVESNKGFTCENSCGQFGIVKKVAIVIVILNIYMEIKMVEFSGWLTHLVIWGNPKL